VTGGSSILEVGLSPPHRRAALEPNKKEPLD
jgi:hypothetical protein